VRAASSPPADTAPEPNAVHGALPSADLSVPAGTATPRDEVTVAEVAASL